MMRTKKKIIVSTNLRSIEIAASLPKSKFERAMIGLDSVIFVQVLLLLGLSSHIEPLRAPGEEEPSRIKQT